MFNLDVTNFGAINLTFENFGTTTCKRESMLRLTSTPKRCGNRINRDTETVVTWIIITIIAGIYLFLSSDLSSSRWRITAYLRLLTPLVQFSHAYSMGKVEIRVLIYISHLKKIYIYINLKKKEISQVCSKKHNKNCCVVTLEMSIFIRLCVNFLFTFIFFACVTMKSFYLQISFLTICHVSTLF